MANESTNMKIQLTQIKTYCMIASLSALVIASKAQTVFPGSVDIVGGPSYYNVSLFVTNDSVGTMLMTVPSSFGVSGSFGLNPGGGFLQHDNGPFLYFDSNVIEMGNQSTSQQIIVNSGGAMDMVDASGSGLHLDGSGHLNNDSSFSSDAGTFYSDGSGNVTATSVATTGNNTAPATSVNIPYSPSASPFVWANTTTQNIVVYVDRLQGSVSYNGASIFSSVSNAPVTVMLQPGASVSIVNNVTATNWVTLNWHQF